MIKEVIYIGGGFYDDSFCGEISSLYLPEWKRFDWGKVKLALRARDSIFIRPATGEELKIAGVMFEESIARGKEEMRKMEEDK